MYVIRTAALLVSVLLLSVTSLQAAERAKVAKPPVTVKVTQTFPGSTADGSFTCALVKDKWIPGTLKKDGVTFTSHVNEIRALEQKFRLAVGAAKRKLKSRIARLKKLYKGAKPVCAAGPDETPAPVDPLASLSRALTVSDINHLFRKAALGYVSPEMLQLGLSQGVGPLVDMLMTRQDDAAAESLARVWLKEPRNSNEEVTVAGAKAYAMVKLFQTKNPFQNQLCLITLHDIIAASINAVSLDSARRKLMLSHFDTLCRINVHGNYRQLMLEITKDPVMLLWLDGALNNRLKPNENYAREFFELFTVGVLNRAGEPNYTDLDVATAARAFTGFNVVNDAQFGWNAAFNFGAFDSEPNKVMFIGTPHQGAVNGWDDLVNYTFDHHPNAAHNIALMLAQRYLREDVDQVHPELVDALAAELKSSNFNIYSMLQKLFKSQAFYTDDYRGTLIRTPAEVAVHMMRTLTASGLQFADADVRTVLAAVSNAGMEIGNPPTVFGWDRLKEFNQGGRYLEFANGLTTVLTKADFAVDTGAWSYRKLFPEGNIAPSADEVLDSIAAKFGIEVAASQREILKDLLENQMGYVGNQTEGYYVVLPDGWRPSDYPRVRRKLAAVVRVLLALRQFRLA